MDTSMDLLDTPQPAPGPDSADAADVFQSLYQLSPDELDGILKEQNDRFNASYRFMAPLRDQMLENYKKYRSIAKPLRDDLGREIADRANLFIPYPWGIVESAMPRLAGRLPRVHAFPRRDVQQDKVDCIQDLILYALDRMGFLKLQQLWIRQFEIYGWSPLIYFWRKEERNVFSREKGPMGDYVMKKQSKPVMDDFAGRVIDVFDAFFQPGVEDIADGDWFIFREWMSKKDIVARVDGGIFYPEVLDYIKENHTSGGGGTTDQEKEQVSGLAKDFQKHSFGRYEVRYTLENDRIVVTIDGKITARVGDNPHPLQEKAMINLNLLPLPNEPIGIGTVESLGGLPDKLNALSNARLDNISLQLGQVFIADRTANIDFENLVFSAGNVILADNPKESIHALPIPDLGMTSEREILTTKEEMQFTSGISDYIIGVNSGARLSNTATGVSSIIREANAKFSLKLAAFEAGALRKLIEAIHVYNMMYMPDEKRIHVLGPKGYTVRDVRLDDILTECDFMIEPGSSAPLDQLSRREGLTTLLDRVMQLPQVVDISKFMKEVLESYDIRNVENMLIHGSDQLPQYQDLALAEAENIALVQGQEIELKGDDRLHIQVHSKAQQTPEVQSHIQLHVQHEQSIMQSATQAGQTTLFGQGGGQPNGQPNGTQQQALFANSPTPTGAGQHPPVGGGAGMGQTGGGGVG